MSNPPVEVVIVEAGREPARALPQVCEGPGATRHLLCHGPDEELSQFAERVLQRLSTLRRRAPLGRIAYVADSATDESGTRARLLERVVRQLRRGSAMEFLCCRADDSAWWTLVDPLLSAVPAGVTVSARVAKGLQATQARSSGTWPRASLVSAGLREPDLREPGLHEPGAEPGAVQAAG
jgi:hypothetical protein